MKPGIYNIPFDEYARIDAVSPSSAGAGGGPFGSPNIWAIPDGIAPIAPSTPSTKACVATRETSPRSARRASAPAPPATTTT